MESLHTFDTISNIINNEIEQLSYKNHNPQSLFDPITYILSLGGKRVRPALALMSYNMYKSDVIRALPIAVGIEVFHNFTLLHDDLMDRANVRRGMPTVHVKWYDNLAILSGDAMLIEAYKEIAKVEPKYLPQILDLFSTTATEICCGQQLDMEFESRMDVTEGEYLEMIRLKTAVLLGCALKEGAIVAGADARDANNLYEYGINIGLAFQLMDDLLDVYGDETTFGKRIGGDILCNKKTFLLINALTNKDVEKELHPWLNKDEYDEIEKIEAITNIYNTLQLKEKSEQRIEYYYQKALDCLEQVNVEASRKEELKKLSASLMFRKS